MSKAGAVCFPCQGSGLIRMPETEEGPRYWSECQACNGTGMDPIPWAELFNDRWAVIL